MIPIHESMLAFFLFLIGNNISTVGSPFSSQTTGQPALQAAAVTGLAIIENYFCVPQIPFRNATTRPLVAVEQYAKLWHCDEVHEEGSRCCVEGQSQPRPCGGGAR